MARRVEINYCYTSHRGPVTGTYWTFFKKKMQGKCNERRNSPPITFKKEQTNKQTKKQKQNKTNSWSRFLMTVINSGSASSQLFSSFRQSSTTC